MLLSWLEQTKLKEKFYFQASGEGALRDPAGEPARHAAGARRQVLQEGQEAVQQQQQLLPSTSTTATPAQH